MSLKKKTPKEKIKDRMSFTTVTKKTKCLERNLPKGVKNLSNGTYKSLVKEIEKEIQTQNWKNLSHSWIIRKNMAGISTLLMRLTASVQCPSKHQWHVSQN